ncbi:MAG: PBP1A family penicillin-binding protein, partial [Candidatus Magasanikbacteria bacterium]|nr:PBP1A family penicillin-binding protein [Candidatus Magasanikbacteria bacterium]
MPRSPRGGRSYGYVNTPPDHSPKKRKKIQKNQSTPLKKKRNTSSRSFVPLLLLPLRLLGWLLVRFFGFFAQVLRKKGGMKQLFKYGVLSMVLLFVLAVVSTIWIGRNLPDPDRLSDRPVAQSTKIYDRTGDHLLYEIFADEKRTLVSLEEIPQELIDAVISTEDTAFYEHRGVRPLSIARSIVYGLVGKGRIGGGASTLTQQLVKNAILTNERKITRKVKEILLSVRLEQKYTKDQILQIYFNEIPYGSTNYGVQSAAQSYFGKDVSKLTLQESATLAGLPRAPSTYLGNPEALKKRRDFVLFRMAAEGKITEAQKVAAQAEPLTLSRSFSNIKAPHFVLYVKKQLAKLYGEQLVETGGLKVITSLDWDKQQIAEQTIEDLTESTLTTAGADNAALLALDPRNGHILSLVGSRDFYDDEIDGQFNVITLGLRQPGSSIKPIIYAAAFEKGYTPETVLFDTRTNFAPNARAYTPENYDLQERGPVTMRQALQGSLNIPAVKTQYLVGNNAVGDFLSRLNYTTLDTDRLGLSLVLGGGEVKPMEHISSFAILANNGKNVTPVSILKVEDNQGAILQEWKATRAQQVIDNDIIATITNVLQDDEARAYLFGAGGVLTLPGRPVAAKTGTTNNYKDAWTVGYTPSLVTGVWAGNTNNKSMTVGFGGSRVAAPIWQKFMTEALKDTKVESFPTPPANDAEKPVLRGSQGGGITLKIDKVTNKLATTSTPPQYIVERTYIPPHSI